MRTLSGHQLRPGPRKDDDPGLADLRSLHSAVKTPHKTPRDLLTNVIDGGLPSI
jgi:hypothetical protein